MKYTYKYTHKQIPKILNTAQLISIAKLNPDHKLHEEDEFEDIITGGIFIPDDMKSKINITPDTLIRKNKDMINANNCYLASFTNDTGCESYQDKVNLIGKWNNDIDLNAFIYYVIVDDDIRKMLFSKPIEFGQATDVYGIINIIEDNGDMVYCQPDEGDIMFDNLPEAEKYIKEHCELYSPIKNYE